MTNIKPLLAIYNTSKRSNLENLYAADFQVESFTSTKFNTALAKEIAVKSSNDQVIVVINAQAELPKFWFARLHQTILDNPNIDVCSALSCNKYGLSPLSEDTKFKGASSELDNIIYLLQKPTTIYCNEVNLECFIVRVKSKLLQLDETPVYACNNLLVQTCWQDYIELTDKIETGNQKPLPAHPLAKLQWRLKKHLTSPPNKQKYPLLDGKPTLLHITMGWGGGVHKWINDFCLHQDKYHHLILSSDGELYRQSHGESLALHYGQTNGLIMQTVELQSPIKATCINHVEYKQILDDVLESFQISQIVVSSLIGHSFYCLQTGVSTVRVLHDYFPSWPSLIANLDKEKITEKDLALSLEQTAIEPFGKIKKQTYVQWRDKLHEIYQSAGVSLVAPSQSVVENLTKLDGFPFDNIAIIPHAIAPFKPIEYKGKKKRFKILVLGRINPPKGQKLLEEIIDKLGTNYYFVFIGAGNEGKKYLNIENISITMDFDNADFPTLMQQVEPDLALITSQTSETFNYTLSELQQAGICTVSTKYGALKNRIVDAETGFLCDDNASDIATLIRHLKNNPKEIIKVRDNLSHVKLPTFKLVINNYTKIFAPIKDTSYRLTRSVPVDNILAKKLQFLDKQKQQIKSSLADTQKTLDERTKWGQSLTKQLKKADKNIKLERKESKYLKQVIQEESQRMTAEIKSLQRVYEKTYKQLQLLKNVEQELNNVEQELNNVEQELKTVYSSRSWRLTRPLRQFATWARHKRNAIKFRFAQIKTLPARAIRSLKTRGVTGTVSVVKNKVAKKPSNITSIQVAKLTQNFKHIEIKPANKPQVSIIIPVFNHFEHTYNCLNSLAQLGDKTSFEVIVVDDCSTDDTTNLIKKISGINYIKQKQNKGFIVSCNTGAEHAKGQYLLFLNNDTMVHANWLDSLLSVFNNYDDAGLAGSKLVYPDGQLQEAGGIVFADARGWNYGRLGSPDEPWYNHVREVDYCSGASILVPKELFKELGQFDKRYKPAYYEDTDLAFAVRTIGKKVYYQPASVVTHYEGISSGTDLTKGMKKYQVINQSKFKQKWAQQLTHQPEAGTNIELCRFHSQQKRIFIFDACTPTPNQDSGSLRMINLIKILKRLNYHIVFMPENLSYDGAYTQDLQQLGVECIYTPTISNPVEYLKDKGKYLDAVILSRYYVAEQIMPFIRDYCPRAKIIFDTVDLHYVRERRMAELGKDKKLAKMAEETRLKELTVAKACDITLVVSPYEVEVLAEELPKTEVKVLTNIHEIYGCRKGFKQRKDIMFIGGYQHTPNVDAVEWFVKEIFPLVLKELPELKFHIIGSKAPKHIQELANNNIIYQGFVEDIEPVMDDIRIAVAPLRFGAGVKGKVNLSMSYGQPVVGTKVAVEGMYAQEGVDVLMAETPEQFAQQIVRLYQDEELWNTISDGGLENVQNFFSFASAKLSIKKILKID